MYLEQYDFRTNTWTSLPAKLSDSSSTVLMLRNRAFHSATLAPNGKIYITGGESVGYINDDIDLWEYDPEVGEFSPMQNTQVFSPYKITHSSQSAVALLDGRILYIMDFSNYIRVFDTNSNQVFDQEVQGYDKFYGGGNRPFNSSVSDYPNIRQGGSPVLAPNPRYIYVYGGSLQIDHIFQEIAHDIIILDIEMWT
ncbi:hypothetical protein BDA99DRAFT_561218 [Phascolomyces articulosus]|uniref:Kelch repeat protein n=1 Tax=Phascolomyces articulosus TaxID=60185 RepID=A0AAD5JXF7_9FUNG|nr:hypothetical protein BDA99DRAFT_561218 [Phascolomyces articulosus]